MVFALQKYGFCRAKRWFLHCKKWVFVLLTINIRGTNTVLVLYEHYVTANCSPRYWQTVRSRRGRFIAPAYTKTPTKWQTEMCVWWCGNVYLIMWKCVFGYGNTHFWLRQDTGTMNRPLRLTVCSLRILRNVHHVIANRRHVFRVCSPHIYCLNIMYL